MVMSFLLIKLSMAVKATMALRCPFLLKVMAVIFPSLPSSIVIAFDCSLNGSPFANKSPTIIRKKAARRMWCPFIPTKFD